MASTTHTETGVAADHGGGGAAFQAFDSSTFPSQLLWLAIAFGLFYYLMSKVALPRISSILETRSDRIAQDLDEANRLKDEADVAIAAYEQELAEARQRAHNIAQEARDKSKAELDAKRSSVEADLAQQIEEAEKRITSIKSKAMGEVDSIAEETATSLLAEIFSGKVKKADIASAVSALKN